MGGIKLLKNFKLKDSRYMYFYILFALCIGAISFMMSYGLSGNDFWWHIKAGEWITENMTFPKYDTFSWNAKTLNLKWTAHEWLSEVVYYGVFSLSGQIGIYLLCFLMASILLFLLYKVCKKYVLKNILYTILFFIFSAALFKIYVYARPHVFSYFLLLAELKILYDYSKEKNKKAIYLIPVIGILWANFHGGSSNLTYVLCIFFILTGLFSFTFGKVEFTRMNGKSLKELGIVTTLSIGSICINPYGAHMLIYPYSNMADKLMLDLITEWSAPDAKDITIVIFFFIPFAIGLISLITTNKNIKAIDLLIFAFFSYMFFRSSRFIVFLIISLPFYAFDYIPEFGNLEPLKNKTDKIMGVLLLGLMCCITIAGFINCSFTYKNDKLISRELDNEFIDLIKEDAPQRPYTDYNYGGDLIYAGIDVYVDGRADVYTGIPLADYYNLTLITRHEATKENYEKVGFVEDILEKYNFDAFLIDTRRPFYQYLTSHPEKYELIKTKKNTSYFRVIE